jgi:protein-S-isoprenylcysteine O-methyltransferase Ste14
MARVRTAFVAVRAVLYAAGFVLFWGWLASGARNYDASLGLAPSALWKPAGVALLVSGAALVLACVASFVVAGEGTPAPFDPPVVFVPSGPYRYVRNPMYLGAALLLAGYGLLEGSASVVLLSLLLLLAAHIFVVLVEEPGLERRFGESYLAYKRSVRRWQPRRPSASS